MIKSCNLFLVALLTGLFCSIWGNFTDHPYIAGIGTGLFVTCIIRICIKARRRFDYAAALIYCCISVYFSISGEISWIAALTTIALSAFTAVILSKRA